MRESESVSVWGRGAREEPSKREKARETERDREITKSLGALEVGSEPRIAEGGDVGLGGG